MADTNEQSIPSRGSHGSPVAWAVTTPADGTSSPCFFNENDARTYHSQMRGMRQLIPLCRQPTLTDEEREAIREAMEGYCENDDDPECNRIAWILSGLLQRTK